ncbi:hypothetical protein ACH47B_20170 [Rhodococcus sp. NPDC019627]|uniref:hypothetical protein n=1 Tax=unclassified Rhodococcus (in: high G+C Gram-positive bacteria) TaxID=192944 RepID=UPI0033EE90EF
MIEAPVLIVPGADERHPAALAERMSATIPYATLARTVSFDALRTASPPPSSRKSAASSTSEAVPVRVRGRYPRPRPGSLFAW